MVCVCVHACMCTRMCVSYEYPMLVPQSSDVQKTSGSGLPSLWSLLTYINISWRCWAWTRTHQLLSLHNLPWKLVAPLQKDCCPFTLWTHQLLSLHTLDSPAAVPTHSGLTSCCPYTLWTHQLLSLHTLDSPAAVPTQSGLTSCCPYTIWTHQLLSLHNLDSPAAVPTQSGLTSCCRDNTHSGLTSSCPYTICTSGCPYTLWTHQLLSLHTLDSPTINKPGAAGCIT